MSEIKCKIILTERGKMIATAIALQDATKEAVMDRYSLGMVGQLFNKRDNATDEEFKEMLFDYSAHLSALTATLVMGVCLTESQLNEMIDTIKEIESIEKDLNNGNK